MTQIDDRIAGALDADDRAFLASLDEGRGLFTQMGDVLSGPLAGWTRIVFAFTFVLALATFFSVWQLIAAETDRAAILWATATVVGFSAIGFTKDWFFSRMNLLTVLRELKRVQLELAMRE